MLRVTIFPLRPLSDMLESICREKEIQLYSLEYVPETVSMQLCSVSVPWKREEFPGRDCKAPLCREV